MSSKWGRKKQVRASHAPEHAVAKLDTVLVSTDSSRRRLNAPRYFLQRKTVSLLGIVIIGALGGFVYYQWDKDRRQPVVQGPVCSRQLLNRAVVAFEPEKVAELEPVANEIKQLPRYEQDPNCLYVLMQFYVNTSDAQGASATLAKLEASYNPGVGYDEALVAYKAEPPAAFRPVIEFLNAQAARQQKIGPDGAPQ